MQGFFNLSRVGIDRNKWSKKKFTEIVTSHLETFPGVQFFDMKPTTGWDMYKCLIPVESKDSALVIRKEVNRLCKTVNSKCTPYYFRFRNKDVETIEELSMFGLTYEESVIFNQKAPPGVYREIEV